MDILTSCRHTTAKELAGELGVTARTIWNDVKVLSGLSNLHAAGRERWDFSDRRCREAPEYPLA